MRSSCSLTKDLDLFPLFKIYMGLSACRPRGPSSGFQLMVAAYATDFFIYSNFLSNVNFFKFSKPPINFQTACSDCSAGSAYFFTIRAELNMLSDHSQRQSFSTRC